MASLKALRIPVLAVVAALLLSGCGGPTGDDGNQTQYSPSITSRPSSNGTHSPPPNPFGETLLWPPGSEPLEPRGNWSYLEDITAHAERVEAGCLENGIWSKPKHVYQSQLRRIEFAVGRCSFSVNAQGEPTQENTLAGFEEAAAALASLEARNANLTVTRNHTSVLALLQFEYAELAWTFGKKVEHWQEYNRTGSASYLEAARNGFVLVKAWADAVDAMLDGLDTSEPCRLADPDAVWDRIQHNLDYALQTAETFMKKPRSERPFPAYDYAADAYLRERLRGDVNVSLEVRWGPLAVYLDYHLAQIARSWEVRGEEYPDAYESWDVVRSRMANVQEPLEELFVEDTASTVMSDVNLRVFAGEPLNEPMPSGLLVLALEVIPPGPAAEWVCE